MIDRHVNYLDYFDNFPSFTLLNNLQQQLFIEKEEHYLLVTGQKWEIINV